MSKRSANESVETPEPKRRSLVEALNAPRVLNPTEHLGVKVYSSKEIVEVDGMARAYRHFWNTKQGYVLILNHSSILVATRKLLKEPSQPGSWEKCRALKHPGGLTQASLSTCVCRECRKEICFRGEEFWTNSGNHVNNMQRGIWVQLPWKGLKWIWVRQWVTSRKPTIP